MLVLTRNPGESILIGEDVEITVVAIQGQDVRLRITTLQTVSILVATQAEYPDLFEKLTAILPNSSILTL